MPEPAETLVAVRRTNGIALVAGFSGIVVGAWVAGQ